MKFKITKSVLASMVACLPVLTFSSVLGDLNSMFMSNSTGAQTIADKHRTGVFLGSMTLRTPVKQVNIVSFDPPRISAGCGGVDLYGGNFSFISGEEIIKTLRQVAANASGLAFKAAIKLISPSLDALLTEFQTLLQSLNNLSKNTCALAHLIVEPASKAIEDANSGVGATNSVRIGALDDMTASLKAYNNDAASLINKAAKLDAHVGNQNMKAIVRSGVSAQLGVYGTSMFGPGDSDANNPNSYDNRVLISMLGYEVTGASCKTLNEAGSSSNANAALAAALAPNGGTPHPTSNCNGPATITLDNLLTGGGANSSRPDAPLRLYSCANPDGDATAIVDPQGCTIMQAESWNYQGIEGWVNTMLFGSNNFSVPTADSIIGLMNTGQSLRRTQAQKTFILKTGLPIDGLLTRINNPSARIETAQKMSLYISNCIGARTGEALYTAARLISYGNDYKITEAAKANTEALRKDFIRLRTACLNDKTVLDKVVTLSASATINGNNK